MDPNVLLQDIRKIVALLVRDADPDSLVARFDALDTWLSKGGLLPRAWLPYGNDEVAPLPEATPLTTEEIEQFNAIRQARNIALLQGYFDGQRVPLIVSVHKNPDPADQNSEILSPLGMLFDPANLDPRVQGPGGEIPTPSGTEIGG